MFEGLIDRFALIKRKILGYGRITSQELQSINKEIKISLLEADVNYLVVKNFMDGLEEKTKTLELSRSLKPGDLVIRAVFEELVELLGSETRSIDFRGDTCSVLSLIGLQGVGKTTTAAKLAQKFHDRNPLLVPADTKRPAAVQQLQMLADRAKTPMVPLEEGGAVATVKKAKQLARDKGYGLIIIDTAGRLHIDDELIEELEEIHRALKPDYRLLIADGMSGQDAVNQASRFNEKIGLDGAILTKMDGDARGGAALSIKSATDVPLYFIGTSEKLDGLETFHPDRMAQRILGMGDVVSLVEKIKAVEGEIDQERIQKKVLKGDLNLEDFLEQLKAVKKLGSLSKLAAMIPGVKATDIDEGQFKKMEAMINSMTRRERLHPEIIDGSRKRRIAAGSGTTIADVNRMLKEFSYARDMLKKFGRDMPMKMPFKIPK
ncbi:MAG: signal recognition particle protein [candidate division WOR-3 bacterium]|nr:MAG: signal recognition particle protein [candidate division WOR-3 bacterium]